MPVPRSTCIRPRSGKLSEASRTCEVSGEPPRKQEGKRRQEGGREREAGGGRAWGLVLKWQEAPGPGTQWDSYLLSGD